MALATKDWDKHVVPAEDVARSDGFQFLRDRILWLAEPQASDVAVDVGAGTGLLTLPLAERVARVFAIDISQAMVDYLGMKATSADLDNIETAAATAISLPLVDQGADLVVSNYCFHHLRNRDKQRAVAEAYRVLRPGGRFVFGDMMFRVTLADARDRRVVADKARALARKGPAGIVRLVRNTVRLATGRWESPAPSDWWEAALSRAGFVDVDVKRLEHEGGIAFARRPG